MSVRYSLWITIFTLTSIFISCMFAKTWLYIYICLCKNNRHFCQNKLSYCLKCEEMPFSWTQLCNDKQWKSSKSNSTILLIGIEVFYLIPVENILWKIEQNFTVSCVDTAVISKVRRTVAKVWQKWSWTDKIILIVGPIDRLTYARKYFIFGKFSNTCQIKIFDHCSHRKFSSSSRKIPFPFLKYWYGDFSNCRKGILNHYLYYALNNESCMAIICHRSFVEIKLLGLRHVAGAIPGKSLKRKRKTTVWGK
jgi:hypothetical protein